MFLLRFLSFLIGKKKAIKSVDSHTKDSDINYHFSNGLKLQLEEKFEEAERFYELVLGEDPNHFDSLHHLGILYFQTGNFSLSAEFINKAILLNPNNAASYSNLGLTLQKLGRYEESVASFDLAIQIHPYYHEAFFNRGISLYDLGRFEEAVESYDKAILLKPDYVDAFTNKGASLYAMRRLEDAVESYDQAISINPRFADAYANLGIALHDLKRFDEAIAGYDRALSINPIYEVALWNKANALLLNGDYELGWHFYEWRWKIKDLGIQHGNFSQPVWSGAESLEGKTILIHCEQGLGDSIQFCRYAKLVKNLGAKVVFEVPSPLATLFRDLDGVDQLIEKGSPSPSFDFHCLLMSLPLAFKTHIATIPTPTSYLTSDAALREAWKLKLGEKTKPRVGIVWSGSTEHKNDKNRSLSLRQLLKHLPLNYEYVSLQKEIRDTDMETLRESSVKHFGDSLKDFTDTAALCCLMDLVISVDTSVAHLCGALGKKTLILLPYVPDWRWLLDRTDSPWYDSVQLYRQSIDRQWDSVLQQINTDLASIFGSPQS